MMDEYQSRWVEKTWGFSDFNMKTIKLWGFSIEIESLSERRHRDMKRKEEASEGTAIDDELARMDEFTDHRKN